MPGVGDGTEYKFFIAGTGSKGFKRDPYARELTVVPKFPESNCIVRRPDDYPWHDQGFRMPAFSDLVVYQFHIGVYYAADANGNDARESGRERFSTWSTGSSTWWTWASMQSSRCR